MPGRRPSTSGAAGWGARADALDLQRVVQRLASRGVGIYETDAELIAGAGGYVADGAHAGAVAIVIATEAHRKAFEGCLRDTGVDVAAGLDEGTVVSLDAAATLARFSATGASIGMPSSRSSGPSCAVAATGRPVCAYGEMVALLWDAGDVIAAIELETLWNELATEVPFSLYCAYRSESVAGHEHADALQQVCHLHDAAVSVPPLETTWRFAAELTAPAEARYLLTGRLRLAGYDGNLLADAGSSSASSPPTRSSTLTHPSP